MKRTFWIWIVLGALIVLTIGFVSGAYFGFRQTLLTSVRRDVRLFGPDHDALVCLGKYGSKEDIPSLLYGLNQLTNREICTYGHCVEALCKLSGANPGDTYGDWTNWWVRVRNEPVPDWHPAFYLISWKKFIQQESSEKVKQPIYSGTNSMPSAAGVSR